MTIGIVRSSVASLNLRVLSTVHTVFEPLRSRVRSCDPHIAMGTWSRLNTHTGSKPNVLSDKSVRCNALMRIAVDGCGLWLCASVRVRARVCVSTHRVFAWNSVAFSRRSIGDASIPPLVTLRFDHPKRLKKPASQPWENLKSQSPLVKRFGCCLRSIMDPWRGSSRAPTFKPIARRVTIHSCNSVCVLIGNGDDDDGDDDNDDGDTYLQFWKFRVSRFGRDPPPTLSATLAPVHTNTHRDPFV